MTRELEMEGGADDIDSAQHGGYSPGGGSGGGPDGVAGHGILAVPPGAFVDDSASGPLPSAQGPPRKPRVLETWLVLEFCNRGSLSDAVEKVRGRTRRLPQRKRACAHACVHVRMHVPAAIALLRLRRLSACLPACLLFVCKLVRLLLLLPCVTCTQGLFQLPGKRGPHLAAILATAREVAAAMSYLHHHNVLHGDLTGNNVLLTTSLSDPRGFTAKVRGCMPLASIYADDLCMQLCAHATPATARKHHARMLDSGMNACAQPAGAGLGFWHVAAPNGGAARHRDPHLW